MCAYKINIGGVAYGNNKKSRNRDKTSCKRKSLSEKSYNRGNVHKS